MAHSLSKELEFIELRIMGMSFASIATKIGVSKQTLITWNQKGSVKEAIAIGQQSKIQAILHEHRLDRTARIERLAKLSALLYDELDTRDYKSIPTDKLLKMAFTTEQSFKDLILEQSYHSSTAGIHPLDLEGVFKFNPMD